MRFALVLMFLMAGCHHSSESKGCSSDTTCLFDVTNLGDTAEGELPHEASTFETNIGLTNFDSAGEDKVIEATELIKKIVASEEFRDAVLNHTYNGVKTFADNGGLTNAQIYDRFLIGAEKLTPAHNNAMDAQLELYYEATSTIGYTTPTTTKIFMNTKYFNSFTSVQVAANLCHEWTHKLGFGHSATSTPERPYSVPYGIGSIITRLAKLL